MKQSSVVLPFETLAEGRVDDQILPMYIDGAWLHAADGATLESYEPALGVPWIHVSEAGPGEIDRAVVSARAALEGPWGKTLAHDRARLLWRMAELIDANRVVLAALSRATTERPYARHGSS